MTTRKTYIEENEDDNQNPDQTQDKDQNQDQNTGNEGDDDDTNVDPDKIRQNLSEDQQAFFKSLLRIELKKMKENMDRMSKERDKAIREKVALEEEKREQETKRLEKEGKLTEALQLKLTAAEERARLLQEKLDARTRNEIVDRALSKIEFRSPKLATLARNEIIGELQRDSDGEWVHKSGVSLDDFIKTYVEDEENASMFAPRNNSGSRSQPSTREQQSDTGARGTPKSFKGVPASQMLELARKGKLGTQISY